MHISIILFFGFLIGVAAISFLAGLFWQSFCADVDRSEKIMEARIQELAEKEIADYYET